MNDIRLPDPQELRAPSTDGEMPGRVAPTTYRYRSVGDSSEGVEVSARGLRRLQERGWVNGEKIEVRAAGARAWRALRFRERPAGESRTEVPGIPRPPQRRWLRSAVTSAFAAILAVLATTFAWPDGDPPGGELKSNPQGQRSSTRPVGPETGDTVAEATAASIVAAPAAVSRGDSASPVDPDLNRFQERGTGWAARPDQTSSPPLPEPVEPEIQAEMEPDETGGSTGLAEELVPEVDDVFDSLVFGEPEGESTNGEFPARENPGSPPLPAPAVRREPAPSEIRQRKASLRSAATAWLRARQSVFLVCEGCGGAGFVHEPVAGRNGLVTKRTEHRSCGGTGAVFRPQVLRDLERAYLPGAQSFDGLEGPIPTEAEVREVLRDRGRSRASKVAWLKGRLGLISGKADVVDVRLDDDDGLMGAVTASVEPRSTQWLRAGERWYLAAPEDLDGLLASMSGSGEGNSVSALPAGRRQADDPLHPAPHGDARIAASRPDRWPSFSRPLGSGRNRLTIENPNDVGVVIGLRSGSRGLDLRVPARGQRTVSVGDGTLKVCLFYVNEEETGFRGDDITLRGHAVRLRLEGTTSGNYGYRRL